MGSRKPGVGDTNPEPVAGVFSKIGCGIRRRRFSGESEAKDEAGLARSVSVFTSWTCRWVTQRFNFSFFSLDTRATRDSHLMKCTPRPAGRKRGFDVSDWEIGQNVFLMLGKGKTAATVCREDGPIMAVRLDAKLGSAASLYRSTTCMGGDAEEQFQVFPRLRDSA